MASQITSLTIVYSTVYSGAVRRKHQGSASLAFVRGIHRCPMNSPYQWPVTRKMFPFDDVVMNKTTENKNSVNTWWNMLVYTLVFFVGLVSRKSKAWLWRTFGWEWSWHPLSWEQAQVISLWPIIDAPSHGMEYQMYFARYFCTSKMRRL